jgi:hypothetical protein
VESHVSNARHGAPAIGEGLFERPGLKPLLSSGCFQGPEGPRSLRVRGAFLKYWARWTYGSGPSAVGMPKLGVPSWFQVKGCMRKLRPA